MAQTANSVMDFAIQAEIDGEAFYTAAAEKTNEKGIKAYLTELAKEEKKHAETFQALKERVQKKGVGDVFVNPRVDDYLDAVLRSGLFEMAKQAVPEYEAPKTIDDVYRIALRAERSSILLYEAILEGTKDRGLKRILKKVLREEKSHLTKIVYLRANQDGLFAVERFGCMC
ncbi:MAG: ferritin family protein [Spirochaetes bacterium]|nr:ferritin family protein [Spirochaetota bacterium]